MCLGERKKALEAEHPLGQNVNARSKRKERELLGVGSHAGGGGMEFQFEEQPRMAWVQEWGDLGTRTTRDGLKVTQQGRGSNPGNLLPSSELSAALSSLPM